MKRRDELLVGFTILFALAVVVGGALWLSERQLGQGGQEYVARFNTVGGLSAGSPVVLRGVQVGRVQEIRLAEGDWVEAVLSVYPDVVIQGSPAVIAASASLFGEWQASIVSRDSPDISDPNVLRDLELAAAQGDDAWPGATLPDIGQLTAQAGRIASDIGAFSNRIQTAFDDEAVVHLQSSIRDFGQVAERINEFADQQTSILGDVADNVRVTSNVVTSTAEMLQRIMSRLDTATAEGELDSILRNASQVSADLRLAMEEFRDFVAMVNENTTSIDRIIAGADTVFSRLTEGTGTVARLVSDSTLYVETSLAIQELRALLADIKENPRKYFKFSVF
jgi:phospholipid/cholesterol/gamma-HCH transport system substrate-binding protein